MLQTAERGFAPVLQWRPSSHPHFPQAWLYNTFQTKRAAAPVVN